MEEPDLRKVLEETKTIAVIGMREQGAAGYVPMYMKDAGYEITPVNPGLDAVFGIPALDTLDDLDQPVDMVNIFRRSEDVPGHLEEILRAKPKYAWMQLGIANEAVAQKLREAGIGVVQNRCLMVEHGRLMR
ncbi:MAG: CoA-binding protein [Dehalococcoidia bacterium]